MRSLSDLDVEKMKWLSIKSEVILYIFNIDIKRMSEHNFLKVHCFSGTLEELEPLIDSDKDSQRSRLYLVECGLTQAKRREFFKEEKELRTDNSSLV